VPLLGPGRRWNLAEYISYGISLVPVGRINSSRERAVHRQIVDGRRGTVTELEFGYLHRTVRFKLQQAIADIQAEEADRAEQARRAQAHAHAFSGGGGQYASHGGPSRHSRDYYGYDDRYDRR
jgi:hypothetical protein